MDDQQLVPFNIRDLSPYVAGKTIEEVQSEYNFPEISKLVSNENRVRYSSAVQPAVIKAMQEIQDYSDPVSRKLCQALAEKYKVDPENIILGVGSESLISNLCCTFFLNNEEVITANATF